LHGDVMAPDAGGDAPVDRPAARGGADALAKLVAMAERGCIVANTLRGAITLTVTSEAVPG
jgi:organic hydroperoxide reductase OsmC/OhrA